VQPGDLGVGDLLPPPAHDVRLTAGFTDVVLDGNDISDEMRDLAAPAWELGLGRESVLSVQGREMAIARWMGGQTGPRAAMAKAAPAQCSSCGFLVAVGGSLGQAFGICANEFGAADGSLVAMTFGCGAHSSVTIDGHSPVPVVELAIDDDADERSDASDLPEYVANAPEAVDGDASESDDSEKDAEDSDERSLDRLSLGDEVADSDSDALGDEDSDDSEEDSEDDDEESNPDGLVEGHISDFLDHIDEDSDHVQMVDDDFEDDYEDERR
jgi:hypothetical protein